MKKMMKKVAAIMLSVMLAIPSMGIGVSAEETLVATGTWDAYKWTDVTGEIEFIYGHLWDENKVTDENANFAYCVNADGSWAIGPRCIIKYKNVDLTKVESITLDTNYNGSTMKIGDCTAESTDTTEVTYDGRTYQYSSNGWKPFGSDVITSWERSTSDNMTFLVPEASKVENATFGIIYDNSSSPKQIKSLTFNLKDENASELTAQDKANEWKSTHQTILDKELETVTNEDMTSVETALETFEVLEADVQALLATEKANLDAKLEKIMALPKTETGTWDAYKWTDVTGEIEFIYGYVADEDVSTDENINFVKNVNTDGSWTICPRGIIKYKNVDLTKVESITLDTNYNENAMYLGDCTVDGGTTTEVSYNGRTYQYARGWKPFGSADVTSWERSAENNMTFIVPETARIENATFAIMYNNSSSPKQINSLTFNLGSTTEPTEDYKLGDVNDDDEITLKDALLALKLTVASDNDFTTQPVLSADVNKNGMIDVQDVLAILQKSNGKEVEGLE